MEDASEFVEQWRKEISHYLLIEYEKKPRILPCHIVYTLDDDLQFSFGSWGIDREEITEKMIWRCCQGALDLGCCNLSISSFYDNYLWFKNDEEED